MAGCGFVSERGLRKPCTISSLRSRKWSDDPLIEKKSLRLSRVAALLLGSFFALSVNLNAQTLKQPRVVPFEFVHNQIVVQARLNGKGPFNMLVDTDTDPSAIDSATAHDLGLSVGASGSTATGGGTEVNTVYAATLGTVELEGVLAKQVAAAATGR